MYITALIDELCWILVYSLTYHHPQLPAFLCSQQLLLLEQSVGGTSTWVSPTPSSVSLNCWKSRFARFCLAGVMLLTTWGTYLLVSSATRSVVRGSGRWFYAATAVSFIAPVSEPAARDILKHSRELGRSYLQPCCVVSGCLIKNLQEFSVINKSSCEIVMGFYMAFWGCFQKLFHPYERLLALFIFFKLSFGFRNAQLVAS